VKAPFNPSSFVRYQFESVDESFHFEFSALQEAMDLLVRADAAMTRQATDSELKHAA